jgi:alkanesulfonate monooxygenase SsuD/methylene tetrahydromethanopterin reductase-like flavin-dependent oxidoreductase (luciferase family)
MAPKLGYLLPTREQIMEGKPDVASLLALAARAEAEGYDSVWVGDSVLARPRHDPLTLLAGVAGRVPRVELGTAVLLPALRNPVLLAHQVATIDQISEGRLILGVGFAADVPNIRAEFAACGVPFDKRIGPHDGRAAPLPRVVDRSTGRLGRALASASGCVGANTVPSGRTAAVDRRQSADQSGTRRQVLRWLVPGGTCR